MAACIRKGAVTAVWLACAWHGQAAPPFKTLDGKVPLVIGHRGASGYLPDHTLAGYRKAIEMGADFIEPDLVATKDGELIARHEPNITQTTDIADRPDFARYKTTKVIDGVSETGWFVTDLTLAQVKTLRAKQPFPERSHAYDGQFAIPTFREILDLAKAESLKGGRTIGVYPETKHPTYHQEAGLPLEDRLLAILGQYGYTQKTSPIIIQSFETANLKYLRKKTPLRLVQLVDGSDYDFKTGTVTFAPPSDRPYDWTKTGRKAHFDALLTPAGLAEVAGYADGIGPWKPYIVPMKWRLGPDGKGLDLNGDGKVDYQDACAAAPTALVDNAHKAGLFVHTWTFRNEAKRLAHEYHGDPHKEYLAFYGLGVDGLFSDFADTAVAARETHVKQWGR